MKLILAGLCALLAASGPAVAQDDHAGHTMSGAAFGRVHFPTSCSPAVRESFDRAVAMLHSFFYPETEKAFRAVAQQDPQCAMAYWGIAISQRPNPLTAPFPPDLLKQGWEAIQMARAANPSTPRERDWIEALAAFFKDYQTTDQRTRSARYESAMARLHATYPDDREASVFYALALLEAVDLTDKRYAKQLKSAALLEALQKAQPEHPGIPHYLIHSYDYAPIAAKGLPAARRYAALAPSAPHALHMPSHTFSTLGMWRDAIASNLAADAANRAYGASTSPAAAANPASIAGRYHPLDFLANAYLQLGQDAAAKAIVDELGPVKALPPTASITAHTGLAAIPVRYALDRSAWQEAASLAPRPSPFKQAEAIVWFGRAIGAARSGDVAGARQDLAEIAARQQQLAEAGDPYWADQVGIQEAAASAWIALADSDTARAITVMRGAADREDRSEKSVAMENRLSPMRELLGELLLEAGRPIESLAEFERALKVVPNRRRSLNGAAKAAEKSGNRRLAQSYRNRWTAQVAVSLSRATPESAGLSTRRLAEATDLLKQFVAEQKIAGAVAAVARKGKLVYLEPVGVQDLATREPMTDRSLFRIYSMTKAVTSVAVMMLFEQGKFRLGDPVSQYLPEFAAVNVLVNGGAPRSPSREMTIEDLLLHTSGLNHRTSREYQRVQVRARTQTLPQFVESVVRVPLMEDPGTRWRYSESTTVLGRLVEIWSGTPFDVFLDQRVFTPLGMTDTGFWVTPDQRSRLTTVYAPKEGGGLTPMEIEALPFTERPTLLEGAVGLVSTVPDYLRFSQMLLNKGELEGARLLTAKTVEMMTANGLSDALLKARAGGLMGWGLGNVNVVMSPAGVPYPASVGEYGWDGSGGTIFWIDPGKEMITILMTQSAPADPDRLRRRFKTLVEQAVVDGTAEDIQHARR